MGNFNDPRSDGFEQFQQESGVRRVVQHAKGLADDLTVQQQDTHPDVLVDLTGTTIGPFRLGEKLGEGGMGVVYAAEQEEPVRRSVALKVIKPGMDTRQVINRFQSERQALALMDHPCIARVIDAGATESGLPYFVMERIDGITIDQYCDQHQLSIRQRLELFIEVCRAVQHAHQKGIIHRDLKPGNVLISLQGEAGVPKIIDFGIAKAVDQQLSDGTVKTQVNQILATPLNMAPEQAAASGDEIDTRIDVYSLGVILFELLTGSTPFTPKQLQEWGLERLRRAIRDDELPRPSDRVSTLDADARSTISRHRSVTEGRLSQTLRGDLDWIVMTALEKDRSRRYQTVSELADDIRHFLDGEVVEARPPSAAYRFSKFIRRNRTPVAAASVILLSLILGIAGTTTGWLRAAQAQQLANDRAEREKEAKLQAIADRRNAETLNKRTGQIIAIVTDSFRSVGPSLGADANMPAKQVLLNAREKMNSSELDDTGKADLLYSLTRAFLDLGQYKDAVSAAREEVAIRETLSGSDSLQLGSALNNLAGALAGRGKFAESLEIQQFLYELECKINGDRHPLTLEAATNLAENYRRAGQVDKAIAIGQEVIAVLKNLIDSSDLNTFSETQLVAMNNLAQAFRDAGKTQAAIELFDQTAELMKIHLGPDYPQTLNTIGNHASALEFVGQNEKAIEILEPLLETERAKLGDQHRLTLSTMQNLSVAYFKAGRFEESLTLIEEAVDVATDSLGECHELSIMLQIGLAGHYRKNNRLSDALRILESLMPSVEETLEAEHMNTMMVKCHLAYCYLADSQSEPAKAIFEEILTISKQKHGDDHPLTHSILNGLVRAGNNMDENEESKPTNNIVAEND